MLLKEELIEKMAKAIIKRAEYARTPEVLELMLKEERPYWNDVAEAALQALLSNLPVDFPIEFSEHKDWMVAINKQVVETYKQLLAMRDK